MKTWYDHPITIDASNWEKNQGIEVLEEYGKMPYYIQPLSTLHMKSGPVGKLCGDCQDKSGYVILKSKRKILDYITITKILNQRYETGKADWYTISQMQKIESFTSVNLGFAIQRIKRINKVTLYNQPTSFESKKKFRPWCSRLGWSSLALTSLNSLLRLG